MQQKFICSHQFGATSSIIVTFSTKSINSTFPINLIIEAWTRKSQPWFLWGGTVALLIYSEKVDEDKK